MMKSLREFTQEVINQCHRACLIVLNQCCLWFPSVLLVGGFYFLCIRSWFDSLRFVTWWFSTVPTATSFQSVNLSIRAANIDWKIKRLQRRAIFWILHSLLSKMNANGANLVYLVAFYYMYILMFWHEDWKYLLVAFIWKLYGSLVDIYRITKRAKARKCCKLVRAAGFQAENKTVTAERVDILTNISH